MNFSVAVNWMQAHLYTVLIISWVLSNAASAMPTPKSTSSQFYIWAFTFMHATFGAVPRIIMSMFPNTWLAKLLPGNTGGTTTNGFTQTQQEARKP
jgi:hypothetical protein